MEYKKLTNSEIRIINYYLIHKDREIAYRLGYPQSSAWKDETIKNKADEFFDSDRIKYFRGFKDGGVVVLSKDHEAALMTEADIHRAVTMPHAVGAHNGGGAPSAYLPEYPRMMLDFFNVAPSTITTVTNEETGETTSTTTITPLPTKAGFAASLRVSTRTLHRWATKTDETGRYRYPEFADAYGVVDAMQEATLVTNTLLGHYQPSFAQFFAKNKLGYKDKADLVIDTGNKPLVEININMSPEEAGVIYKDFLNQKD